MTIGVDAGALSVGDERLKLGVWRISYNLLRELSKIDRTNDYRLYSFRPIEEPVMQAFGPRMGNLVLRPMAGWFSLRLPIELRLHPIDVFLGVSQAIPFGAPKSIGFVYDLGFLHYPEAYPSSFRLLRKRTEELVRRASQIVAISQSTGRDIRDTYQVAPEKIRLAYPGVEAHFKSTGPKFQSENPYFLFVGALKRGKNVPTAIRALAEFLKKSPKRHDFLIIGGNYWEDPEIKRTIKELHLDQRVKLLGFVPEEELPKYYRGAVALVSPSLWEGFCLPAVEAMACGTPVIGSNRGAIAEIVGKTGLLVNPFDVSGLSRAMLTLASDQILRKELIVKGLIKIKQYSWSAMAKAIFQLL